SGKSVLLNVLDRDYLSQFSEVDPSEQNDLIMAAINAGAVYDDRDIKSRIKFISDKDNNMMVRAAALKAVKK
ncbi:MAG: hypothetical protein KC897_08820, partial [Candidatus Omnitrophica bacterium]|nr:hypothetical protein [Candidatus Omnitrophota bacterium]